MKIYIASSWKNRHAVEMMTALLRKEGHFVASFVENNYGEGAGSKVTTNLDEWIWSERGKRAFDFDTDGAINTDLVVYIGPSGTDAWAEVGAAWATGGVIFGLWAKGEPSGLMRRMVQWYDSFPALLAAVAQMASKGAA